MKEIAFIGKRKSRQLLLNTSTPIFSPVHSCFSSPSASPTCSPTPSPSSTQQPCSSGSSSLSTTNSLKSSQKSAIPAPSKEQVKHFYAALACTSNKPAILSLVEPYSSSYIPKALNEDLPVCMSELQSLSTYSTATENYSKWPNSVLSLLHPN